MKQEEEPVLDTRNDRVKTQVTEFDLRSLPFKPDSNPFMEHGAEIRPKTKTVRTRSTPRDMMDPDTGEVVGSSIIHTIEERDEAQFEKVPYSKAAYAPQWINSPYLASWNHRNFSGT